MHPKILSRSLLLVVVALLAAPSVGAARSQPLDRDAFAADMRKLWEDHITWTRLYIVDAIAGLPQQPFTAQRLLQNQDDLGNAIKPFYGEAAGAQLTALLREHILIAVELIDAAKAGDAAGVEDATRRWFANADAIAAFLSSANPRNWPPAVMTAMMHDHLEHTTDEVVAHLQQDFPADIAAYEAVHLQILELADLLSSGIVRQFPNRFRR